MTLDDRKKKILESVIRDYVETAEPVGSRAVVKKHNLKISAATVRNEMADLEEMGYMEQPHTSAGRIPSQMGFRYFVDSIMELQCLTEEEIDTLQKQIKENMRDWDETIAKIGQNISQLTHYASVVILPAIDFNEIRFIQLVPLEEGKALLLVVTDMGLIVHRKIDVPTSITSEDMHIIGGIFNKVLCEKKLEQISRSDLQFIRDELKSRRKFIDKALEAIDLLMENTNTERVFVNGALNILNEPEFKDLEKLKKILALLDEEMLIKAVVPNELGEDITIQIGQENRLEDIKDMSLVLSGYKTYGKMARFGIIGPIRMEYWKAAGVLESIRVVIEEAVNQRY